MEHEIVKGLIEQLTKEEDAIVKKRIADEPKQLKYYIHFKYKQSEKNSRNISTIAGEITNSEFDHLTDHVVNVLLERFVGLCYEEQLFMFSKYLLSVNQDQAALSILRILIKKCWSNNIFELLPEAIHNFIYHDNSISNWEENSKFLTQLKSAIILQEALFKAKYSIRTTIAGFYKGDYNAVKINLKRLRKLSLKYNSYPRFKMMYHYISLGVGIHDNINKVNAISRHINSLSKIMKSNPDMPVGSIQQNYRLLIDHGVEVNTAKYYLLVGDKNNYYNSIDRAFKDLLSHPKQLKLSVNHFAQKIISCMIIHNFNEGLKVTEMLKDFERSKNKKQPAYFYPMMLVKIYTYSYPKIICERPLNLLNLLDESIKMLKESGLSNDYYNSLIDKSCFLFNLDDVKSAVLTLPSLKNIPKNLEKRVKIMLDIFRSKGNNKVAGEQKIINTIMRSMQTNKDPDSEAFYERALMIMNTDVNAKIL